MRVELYGPNYFDCQTASKTRSTRVVYTCFVASFLGSSQKWRDKTKYKSDHMPYMVYCLCHIGPQLGGYYSNCAVIGHFTCQTATSLGCAGCRIVTRPFSSPTGGGEGGVWGLVSEPDPRKIESGKSGGMEVYAAPSMKAHFQLACD